MEFRLLVDIEVIEFLDSVPARHKRRLFDHFREIQHYPGNHCDISGEDEAGQPLDISRFDNFLVYYWADDADRHDKILAVKTTD